MALIVASVPEFDHAQFFNGRVDFSDQFGQIRFDDRRGAVAGTAFSCFLKGFDDAGVGVADDHGPGADVVDVFVAVDVGNGTALAQAMNGGGSRCGCRNGPGY